MICDQKRCHEEAEYRVAWGNLWTGERQSSSFCRAHYEKRFQRPTGYSYMSVTRLTPIIYSKALDAFLRYPGEKRA